MAFIDGAFANCAEVDAAIDAALTGFQSWHDLHVAFSRFRGCDDGVIAEGYSGSVVKLLAGHWDKLADLQVLADVDSAFRSFVLEHIDETTDPRDVGHILMVAEKRCPRTATALCRDVRLACQRTNRMFDADVAARMKAGKEALATPEGQKYEVSWGEVMGAVLRGCIPPGSTSPANLGNFTFVADVDRIGTVSSVEVRPSTHVSRCFAKRFRASKLPQPPIGSHGLFPISDVVSVIP